MAEQKNDKTSWEKMYWKSHKYNERQRLKTGTYLHSFCPHCSKELTKDNLLLLDVVNQESKFGHVKLSPFLNIFELEADIELPEGKELKDILCPHCNKSLLVQDQKCDLCGSKTSRFLVCISNNKVPFNVCMKVGCRWHTLSSQDEEQIILEGSNEW